jgi:hypothetical protein
MQQGKAYIEQHLNLYVDRRKTIVSSIFTSFAQAEVSKTFNTLYFLYKKLLICN